jgi:protein involved in polysaccharide export with SLBB domain
MKKYLLFFLLLLSCTIASAQMSDTQVLKFIEQEQKAGTSQSQIVTKLMQKGVKVDQIQRLRQQYDKQLRQKNLGLQGDQSISKEESRMRRNNGSLGRSGNKNDEAPVTDSADETTLGDEAAVSQIMVDSLSYFHGKKVFGRDIFNNKSLNFEPNMNIATPQNYTLGPGDQVIVDIYGASQKSEQLTVSPDGEITVPGYGPIRVAGLTVAAAQSKIRSTLGSRYASSSLKLTVGQTRTIMVNVMGEVRAPGTYTLSAFATVFHALYMAGGINELGTLRNVKVFRQGRLVTTVDIYQYILSGRLAGNIRLQDNDVIQVGAYDCIVDIAGNVKRPMAYEMRKNESVKTLLDYAGGFTGDAYRKSVRLLRKSGKLKSVYNINEFDMSSFSVDDGDSITVDSILDRYENMVEVRGALFRPGMYRLGEEVNSVKTLIEAADGLLEEAFTAHAVLRRMKPNRTLEVISVDVKGILEGKVADVPLQNEDILFIPTLQERMTERIVTVNGEVQFPGKYEYADNETIEDLILRAGGLTDAASTVKVDISRRIRDEKAMEPAKEISKTFSFALKDGFMVDGDKGFVLEPYDVVQVRRSPGYMEPRNVTIEGEVAFPGQFTLSKKNQRLSEIIEAAGGVTKDAYVRGARLVRHMNEEERVREQATLDALRNMLTGRNDSISAADLQVGNTYVVGIQLDKALENPGGDYDIIVRDSDYLFVPEFNPMVKVTGDVFFPNTVSYVSGKNHKYYVNQAGGFGNRAKKSKTFIVYQNGTIGVAAKGAKPEPGCEIIVPSKKQGQPFNWASIANVASSLTGIAALILAISRL